MESNNKVYFSSSCTFYSCEKLVIREKTPTYVQTLTNGRVQDQQSVSISAVSGLVPTIMVDVRNWVAVLVFRMIEMLILIILISTTKYQG